MVAELAHNQNVEGSSPSPATMGNRKRDRFGGEKRFRGGGEQIKWFGTPRERNQWLKKDEPGKEIVSRKELTPGDWETS